MQVVFRQYSDIYPFGGGGCSIPLLALRTSADAKHLVRQPLQAEKNHNVGASDFGFPPGGVGSHHFANGGSRYVSSNNFGYTVWQKKGDIY